MTQGVAHIPRDRIPNERVIVDYERLVEKRAAAALRASIAGMIYRLSEPREEEERREERL